MDMENNLINQRNEEMIHQGFITSIKNNDWLRIISLNPKGSGHDSSEK